LGNGGGIEGTKEGYPAFTDKQSAMTTFPSRRSRTELFQENELTKRSKGGGEGYKDETR